MHTQEKKIKSVYGLPKAKQGLLMIRLDKAKGSISLLY